MGPKRSIQWVGSLEPILKWNKAKFAANLSALEGNARALKAGYRFAETSGVFGVRYHVPKAPLPPGTYRHITGTEGVMQVSEGGFTIKRSKMPKAPGIGGWDSLDTYPKEMQQKLLDAYNKKYSKEDQTPVELSPITYKAPDGYDGHLDHFTNFFDSVRTGKPVVEDAVFGFRAAAPCLACNDSYFQNKVIRWDAVNMKLT